MRNKKARELRKQVGWKVGRGGTTKEYSIIVTAQDQFIAQNKFFRAYKELKRKYTRGF